VVGFITRGYGISVHRQDCPNADPARRRPEEQGRWISVSWGETHQDAYQTSLDITAKDRQNLFLDVAAALSAAQVKVDSLSAKSSPDGFAIITAVLQVHSLEEIQSVMRKLNGINGVMDVRRAKG
jgi:GTP pyrophosphokinase